LRRCHGIANDPMPVAGIASLLIRAHGRPLPIVDPRRRKNRPASHNLGVQAAAALESPAGDDDDREFITRQETGNCLQ
jgi:hypothetical protein